MRLAAGSPIGERNPQELANTTWAMATLALEEPKLLQAGRPAAGEPNGEVTPQKLANTAWAVATLAVEATNKIAKH